MEKYIVLSVALILVIVFYLIANKFKIGVEVMVVYITAIVGLSGYLFQSIQSNELEERKINLEKKILIWKDQKEAVFDFVEFIDREIFYNNKIMSVDANKLPGYRDEVERVMKELNLKYAKLYLILDTNIINNINRTIGDKDSKTISTVQRYYIFKEIRRQLLTVMNEKVSDYDLPYIDIKSSLAPIRDGEINRKARDFSDLKDNYGFILEGKGKDTYRSLPEFASPKSK